MTDASKRFKELIFRFQAVLDLGTYFWSEIDFQRFPIKFRWKIMKKLNFFILSDLNLEVFFRNPNFFLEISKKWNFVLKKIQFLNFERNSSATWSEKNQKFRKFDFFSKFLKFRNLKNFRPFFFWDFFFDKHFGKKFWYCFLANFRKV